MLRWTVKCTETVSACHQLGLPYKSACQVMHGHNWRITVLLGTTKLNAQGMVVDFTHVRSIIRKLDHQDLTALLSPLNATAENIALWLWRAIRNELCGEVYDDVTIESITVQETEGNEACLQREQKPTPIVIQGSNPPELPTP